MVGWGSLNPFGYGSPKVTTEIAELRIYPIKSCRGISLQKSFITKQGLDLDRRWMLIDADTDEFITIRGISELTLIDTALESPSSRNDPTGIEDDLELIIGIRNTDRSVRVPARPSQQWLDANTDLRNVKIWKTETDGYAYRESINKMFCEYFDRNIALVYKGPTPRVLSGNGAPEHLGREESTNFPDVLPILIANQASILELNQRLTGKGGNEITIERFRPNIIVKGASADDDGRPQAWTEDKWKTVRVRGLQPASTGLASIIKISDTIDIDVVTRCARCQVPNVDPESAVKDAREPWDTLISYRRVDEGAKYKPCFGMLSCPRSEGDVEVGMTFEVLEVTDDHKFIKPAW